MQIRAIRNRQELVCESEMMHHCAGRTQAYTRRVIARELYFYRMIEPERLTIAVHPGPGGWAVEEVRGVYNQLPGSTAMRLIRSWVQESQVPAGSVISADESFVRRAPIVLHQPIPARRRRHIAANQMSLEFQ